MSRFPEVIERMAVDPEFAEHARNNPDDVSTEYGLTAEEAVQMLALTDGSAMDGPTALEARLSKSGIGTGGLAGLLAGAMPGKSDEDGDESKRPLGRWVGPGTKTD